MGDIADLSEKVEKSRIRVMVGDRRLKAVHTDQSYPDTLCSF